MPVLDADGTTRTRSPGPIVAILAFSGVVAALMQTVLIPIIPELPRLLDASSSDTAWAVTATLLTGTVAVPVMGRLGDMFGKRRILLLSMMFLIVGSTVVALSNSLGPLLVGRVLQGLAGAVIPLGISLMRDALPKEKLASSVAMMSASLGIGGALGLPISALIAEYANWHFLFWISAALAAVAAVLILTFVPESPIRSGGTFDYVGATSLSAALIALLLTITKGADWGWTSSTTLTLVAIAAIAFAVWGWWELRTKLPLVDLRVTTGRQVLFTNLASAALGFAMFAMTLVLTQVLQLPETTGYGMGKSMLATGLVMAPFGVVMMLAAPVSARITNSRGPKTTLMTGAVVVAVGYLVGAFALSTVWQITLVGIIIGAGTGLAYGAMPALIMGAVPMSQTSAANSFNTLMRSLGTSLASAIVGVILAQMTMSSGGFDVPTADAFKVTMLVAAGASLLAFSLAAFIPRFKATPPSVELPDTIAGVEESTTVTR
ncbi:MFS transporter [Nocardia sp. 348MFTsu5.1]|uniref:MFS transporter n=1 Tax=Nocardia sp. 348MFTsu5.1 TaxID=1172185 RepID=UPI00037CDBEA|nr:MFS transporter [Nocardia sp. 348MFTsu5.1]